MTTVDNMAWSLATRPQRVVLWIKHYWIWIWIGFVATMLAAQIVRWGINGFSIQGKI